MCLFCYHSIILFVCFNSETEDSIRVVKVFHLIIEDKLLPAVGSHNLLHIAADHGQGEALQGGGVVLRTKANDCIMIQGH